MSTRLDRLALRPVRAGAERAVDGVLAGPLPETIVHSLVEHRVLERIVHDLAGSMPANEMDEKLQQLVDTLVGHVVASPAFKQAVCDTLRSPEVRDALSEQTSGFTSQLTGALRRRAARADDGLELRVHGWLRRPGPVGTTRRFGGLATRGVALVIDAALVQLIFLIGAASAVLVGSLAGVSTAGWIAGLVSAVGWAVAVTVYFAGFWSGVGQTPGMRFTGVRVTNARGDVPSVLRSLLRLVGLGLAIVPLGAGFLPVLFDRRRRGLHDYIGHTEVQYT